MKNFIMLNKRFFKKDIILFIISFIVIIFVWKIISLVMDSEILMPSPEKTFAGLIKIMAQDGFLSAVIHSVSRGILGFVISFFAGMVFGVTAGFNKVLFKMMEPLLVIIKSIPLMSIILVALIWFDSGNVPIFAGFLVSFPIVYTNVSEGIKNVDKKIIEMAKSYKIKKIRFLTEIYIPAISPFIFSAAISSMGIGWKAVIAAEVLSNPIKAIGTDMQLSRIYLQTDRVIAWTVIAVIISFIFETILRTVQKKIIRWKT